MDEEVAGWNGCFHMFSWWYLGMRCEMSISDLEKSCENVWRLQMMRVDMHCSCTVMRMICETSTTKNHLRGPSIGQIHKFHNPTTSFGQRTMKTLRLFTQKSFIIFHNMDWTWIYDLWDGDGPCKLQIFQHLQLKPCRFSFSPGAPWHEALVDLGSEDSEKSQRLELHRDALHHCKQGSFIQ